MPQNPYDAVKKATSIGPAQPGQTVYDAPIEREGAAQERFPTLLHMLSSILGDPTEPGNSLPAAGPAVVSDDLVKALQPLAHGAIDKGKALAAELLSRETPMSTPGKALANHLSDFAPEAPDITKLLAVDKVTGSRPPTNPSINAPEGFAFTPRKIGQVGFNNPKKVPTGINQYVQTLNPVQSLPADRAPIISSLDKVWNDFAQAQAKQTPNKFDKPPISSTINGRPPLSGRWNKKNMSNPHMRSPDESSDAYKAANAERNAEYREKAKGK